MEYKFNTQAYRKLFLYFSPVCFFVWLGFMKFIFSNEQAPDSEIIRSAIFFSVLFLPGAPLLAFYGLDMDYDINISNSEIKYTKRGLVGKAEFVIPFSSISSVSETIFSSLVVTTKDGRALTMVKYLSVDFEGLDQMGRRVYDSLEVNPSNKVVSFIKLLIMKRIGVSEKFQPTHKEAKAFLLLNS